ncbi:MAG: PA2169 family four-helix-bundle protein [Rhodoferax sp.]|nr:PA2169 family four-helix-bundle protein [Rhodoferax sp.]
MENDGFSGAEHMQPASDEPSARPSGIGAGTSVASMAGTWGGPLGTTVGDDAAATGDGLAEPDAEVVNTLNHLIETCLDGEFGFTACAEQANSAELKSVFQQCATDCTQAALELRGHVLQLGGEPTESGTTAGALQRGWVAVRSTLTGYDDQTMLNECETGEDHALGAYRKALKQALPSDVRTVVQRQMDGVQRNHDQIKALRDLYRART